MKPIPLLTLLRLSVKLPQIEEEGVAEMLLDDNATSTVLRTLAD